MQVNYTQATVWSRKRKKKLNGMIGKYFITLIGIFFLITLFLLFIFQIETPPLG